jgi:hypothetical protein
VGQHAADFLAAVVSGWVAMIAVIRRVVRRVGADSVQGEK